MICTVSYTRQGNRYVAGQEYDIDPTVAAAHDAYLGVSHWEGGKKKEAPAAEAAPAEEATPAPKPSRRAAKRAAKGKK